MLAIEKFRHTADYSEMDHRSLLLLWYWILNEVHCNLGMLKHLSYSKASSLTMLAESLEIHFRMGGGKVTILDIASDLTPFGIYILSIQYHRYYLTDCKKINKIRKMSRTVLFSEKCSIVSEKHILRVNLAIYKVKLSGCFP